MSVFAGGATIDAVEPVLGTLSALDAPNIDVFSSVENLVRHSLLKLDASGRLTMLETIREYASILLHGSDDLAPLRQAHATYFRELVLSSQPLLIVAEQAETMQALSAELGNIRQALSYLEQHGPVPDFVEMAAALWRYWSVRGLYSEGRRWLDAAIRQARDNDVEGPLLAAALDGAGILAESQGDAEQAQTLHLEALALWREANDATGIARSLENLGILALNARGRSRLFARTPRRSTPIFSGRRRTYAGLHRHSSPWRTWPFSARNSRSFNALRQVVVHRPPTARHPRHRCRAYQPRRIGLPGG